MVEYWLYQKQIGQIESFHIADITLLLQYALLNPAACTGNKSKHQLHVGIGFKPSSGEFRKNENNMYNTSVQTVVV